VDASELAIVKNATTTDAFDFEAVFREDYRSLTRLIARVVRDSGRAEELAVETFWRLWKTPNAHGESARGWLRRTAIRLAIDELRRRARREPHDRSWPFGRVRTPDELFLSSEEQGRVRSVLAALPERDAELLLLRSDDTSYEELAALEHIRSPFHPRRPEDGPRLRRGRGQLAAVRRLDHE
jgi:RNA polymerase sigma factor (sigma-70 family)